MTDIVELHFIDGPLAGTRKMADESEVLRTRTWRYLSPVPLFGPETFIDQKDSKLTFKRITAVEYHYFPVRLPPARYENRARFAMLLEDVV